MMNGLQSELLKYKRTFMKKLIILIPLFFTVYALITQKTMMKNPLSQSSSWVWQNLLALVFNWWPFIFLPLGYALFAALAAAQEKKSGDYRFLRANNVSPAAIWINKVLAMSFYGLLSTLVLITAVVLAGLLSKSGPVPLTQIAAASITCWVTSLTLIPIQLFAATLKGLFLSMGIGFIGMILGILAAPKPFWTAVPWSWATRLMCPIIGVHPNGTILKASDPLLNPSVNWFGILVSVAVFLMVTLLTSIWFVRREEK